MAAFIGATALAISAASVLDPTAGRAGLEADVGHYVHDPNLNGGGNCFGTDNRVDPINIVFYDYPRPTTTQLYSHIGYHTAVPGDEWDPANETGGALLTWSDGSAGCVGAVSHSQPATLRPAGGIRYHLRVFHAFYNYSSWNEVDAGQAHHEKACGLLTTDDHILAGYSGFNQARDVLASVMGNDGFNHNEHFVGGYYDWGNTKTWHNANCDSEDVASDGYVTYVHIPDNVHSGWP